jgi:hypothetical protein
VFTSTSADAPFTASARSILTDADRAIVDRAEQALADGLELKRWWDRVDEMNGYAERFEFIRQFHKPARSFGFFDVAPVGGKELLVMGSVDEALYDQPKQSPAERVRDEFREFVLHYFMRVSSFEQPEARADGVKRGAPPWPFQFVDLCTRESDVRGGFGFQQLYYKSRATGDVGRFSSEAEQYRIVDLREVGSTYEWLILKVRIFSFDLSAQPLGTGTPALVVTLDEQSYLIVSREFIRDERDPAPGVLAEYGLGYAFIKDPSDQGRLAYGPGHFDLAFQLINFRVLTSGAIWSRLVFVANRPDRILNLSLDPVTWSATFADLVAPGVTGRLMPRDLRAGRPGLFRGAGFDPVLSSVRLLNWITGGLAASELCVTKAELERRFLVQHFMQHYQTMEGALVTWRRIPDWLDQANLPQWVTTGVG